MIRDQIEAYDPDVVISVHPTMNTLPLKAIRRIAARKNKYIPFFTVVTDFGSGHCTWFHRGVDKMYIASDRIRRLAKRRGWVPDRKIVMSGLPIRHGFALQAEKMGDRHSSTGKLYREEIKMKLGLDPRKPVILIMGGGEGVGSLSTITEALHYEIQSQGINATLCVVCGRNDKLRDDLNGRNWNEVVQPFQGNKRRRTLKNFWTRSRRSKRIQQSLDRVQDKNTQGNHPGKVDVIGLGFVSNMDEYMVAADILVTKAGPGTIAEATALSLPVMITSFLPGQEAGNVDIVLDNGFGDFCKDPRKIASELASWLRDPSLMEEMSKNSAIVGHPHAAASIVQDIGKITHEWKERNKLSLLKNYRNE
jgi:1,2-diacylglycerol 3-beta-galactosyltransferase